MNFHFLVPGAGLFCEPFFNDLDLIWRVESKVISLENRL